MRLYTSTQSWQLDAQLNPHACKDQSEGAGQSGALAASHQYGVFGQGVLERLPHTCSWAIV